MKNKTSLSAQKSYRSSST